MNDRMLKKIHEELDQHALLLDQRYAARLSRRRAILRSGHSGTKRPMSLPWMTAAATVLVAVMVWTQVMKPQQTVEPEMTAEEVIDLDVLQSEDFEVAENLDFYVWLDSQLAEGDAG